MKAIAKLRLLERGLMDAAKALDELLLVEPKAKGTEDEKEDDGEAVIIERINHYVELQLQQDPQAKRGDYKDGMVYQARKAAIEEFLQLALASSKKCQRKQCGAYVLDSRSILYSNTLLVLHILSGRKDTPR